MASPDGRDGSLTLHQRVFVYSANLDPRDRVRLALDRDRHAWVQVPRGKVLVAGVELAEGDGMAISDEEAVALEGVEDAEVLLFDLG